MVMLEIVESGPVLLVGFGAYFFNNTIQDWMLVYGGQDFSLWGILEGFVARLIR